jgi:long-chain acyl-CoA synthetase
MTTSGSLIDLLERSVKAHASRPLFLSKREGRWVAVTYAEFAGVVDSVRAGLAGLGIGAGDRVGIISANRVEWAAVAYASYGLRAAVVPMYETQREGDWAFVIRDAGVRVLFVSNATVHARVDALSSSLPSLRHIVVFDAPDAGGAIGARQAPTFAVLAAESPLWPCDRPTPEDVAAVLYTSGTTAEPRGVVLTHGNLVSNITMVFDLVPMPERHRTLSFLPWAHAFGHTLELHGVIAAGASMAIAESVDKIVDNLVEVKPTVLLAVPRVFLRVYAGVNRLLATKPRPVRWLAARALALARRRSSGGSLTWSERLLCRVADGLVFRRVRARVGGRLEFAISGAAALPKEVAEMVDGLGIELYEGYGLTEASPIVSANVPGQRKLGSVGRPLPGVRVVIDRASSTDGREGEVVVYGPNVMRGYHDRPEETSAVLGSDGGLRTGDVGYLDEDGYLYITGRIKEQYKLANGRYVSPGVLEERLKLSPFIQDVMVHGDGRTHNVALVVPDLDAVRAWAAEARLALAAQPDALLADPRVLEKISTEIDALSREFRGYERIGGVALLPEGFTLQNGMLTPSLKLKRREIVARWRAEIERLYREPSPATSAAPRTRTASL